MRVETFAEVFTPDHPVARARGADPGFDGRLLGDVLREHGGRYEALTELPDDARDSIAAAARRTGNDWLAELVASNRFVVSLEHLRDYDPQTTRIVYGVHVHQEPADGETPTTGQW